MTIAPVKHVCDGREDLPQCRHGLLMLGQALRMALQASSLVTLCYGSSRAASWATQVLTTTTLTPKGPVRPYCTRATPAHRPQSSRQFGWFSHRRFNFYPEPSALEPGEVEVSKSRMLVVR